MGEIQESHSRKVLNKCSSWLAEKYMSDLSWLRWKIFKNIFQTGFVLFVPHFVLLKLSPENIFHYPGEDKPNMVKVWFLKGSHMVKLWFLKGFTGLTCSQGTSQVSQAAMLKAVSTCSSKLLVGLCFGFHISSVCQQCWRYFVWEYWFKHHEVQDLKVMWSSPGGHCKGECQGGDCGAVNLK